MMKQNKSKKKKIFQIKEQNNQKKFIMIMIKIIEKQI